MSVAPTAKWEQSAGPKPASRTPDVEVIVIDGFTAESVSGRTEHAPHVSDPELFKAEHQTPDGSAANPHEFIAVPTIIAGLAIAGLLVVGISMYIVGGVQAMAVGLAWVIAGYAVAWSVVWAAGMIRTKEEGDLERELLEKHSHEDKV